MTYSIIYGREGGDYPDIREAGPYPLWYDAVHALDPTLVQQYGGAVIVGDYAPSDGRTITTGEGRVLQIIPPTFGGVYADGEPMAIPE